MKKYFLHGVCVSVILCANNAYAAINAVCQQMANTSYCSGSLPTQMTGVWVDIDGTVSMPGCISMLSQCWETTSGIYSSWYTCNTCASGYTRTQTSATMMGCGTSNYYYCKSNCTGCTNCTSDTSWSSVGTGYEKKVTRTCDCNTCNSSTLYRCAAGYYGSSTNGTSGCTRCPSSGGVYGTSAAGSTAITSCYLPSGTTVSFSDSTGSGTAKYTSDCYYSK